MPLACCALQQPAQPPPSPAEATCALPLLPDIDAVVLGPLAHHARDHLNLRVAVGVVAQHGHHVPQRVLRLLASNDRLEGAYARALLAVHVLGRRVQPLEDVKRLGSVEKVAHLVAVVGNELQKLVAFVTVLHGKVQLPCKARLAVHDVAACQPAAIAVLGAVLFVLDGRQRLLSLLVLAHCRVADAVVPVEVVVIWEVALDGLQEDQHVVKLLEQEEARGHALAAGDGVALAGTGAHQLEVLLGSLLVLLAVVQLSNAGVDHSLEYVLLRRGGLQVLDQVERLTHLGVPQVVDHQVQPCLRGDITQGRKHLQRVLPAPEHHEVVADEVVLQVRAARHIGQGLELVLRSLAVVHTEGVAGLEVHRQRTVHKLVEVHLQDLQGHVVVVQLAVAERHVHVEGQELPVLQQQALVDVSCLLVVAALVLHAGQGQLVLDALCQLLVVLHHLGLVTHLVRAVEEDAGLERAAGALQCVGFCILVQTHVVAACCCIDVVQGIWLVIRKELLVDAQCLVMLAKVELAVC
mmetsp:Transcript_38089/g.84857  ORF Transcript_38089/g.84857 Transcript_38089/m.84857 type:complete len:522 (-) Transcript_38089:342-1907(-)